MEKRREKSGRPDNAVDEVMTDTIRIDVASIPDYVRDSLAAALLAGVRELLRQPGGKEFLDAKIAADRAARKEAQ